MVTYYLAQLAGLEPVTSRVTGECSNQLSYNCSDRNIAYFGSFGNGAALAKQKAARSRCVAMLSHGQQSNVIVIALLPLDRKCVEGPTQDNEARCARRLPRAIIAGTEKAESKTQRPIPRQRRTKAVLEGISVQI